MPVSWGGCCGARGTGGGQHGLGLSARVCKGRLLCRCVRRCVCRCVCLCVCLHVLNTLDRLSFRGHARCMCGILFAHIAQHVCRSECGWKIGIGSQVLLVHTLIV